MKSIKQNWAFLLIVLVTILLGSVTLLTVIRLQEETPVAPTAPQSQPQAVGGNPVAACQGSFTVTVSVSSPNPSATPATVCNSPCQTDSQCPSSMICSLGYCRNPQCTTNPNCLCTSPNPSPTPSPGIGGPNPSPSPTPSPSPSATPVPYCGASCTENTQCPSTMVCYIAAGQTTGACRNPACQTDTDCVCAGTPAASTSPAPSVIPQVPVAGVSWPTIFLIMGGMALLVLGFALP